MDFDVVVLAGGDNRRLEGVDKAMLNLGGRPVLTRIVSGIGRPAIVVGPRRDVHLPVRWCREEPPGGGPVAGLAAALALVRAPAVLTVAGDLPFIADAVADLVHAVDGHEVAVLVDAGGRRSLLAAVWRTSALRSRIAGLDPAGAPVRRLFDGARVAEVADTRHAALDCGTWAGVEAARARIAAGE